MESLMTFCLLGFDMSFVIEMKMGINMNAFIATKSGMNVPGRTFMMSSMELIIISAHENYKEILTKTKFNVFIIIRNILMVSFAVSEEKNRWLREKMEELGVLEKDIEEKFVRSSGKGGQNVNKTSTCVYLKHAPTGIEVKCMKDRSQSINRFLARRELVKKIEDISTSASSGDQKKEKIKRRKSKRKARALLKYGPVV
jgi:protein subunit release factor B